MSTTTFIDTSILVWTQDSQDARSQAREEAADRVRMATHFNVVGVQKEHVIDALRLREKHQLQFWDALNLATAKAAGCTLLLTADVQSAKVIEGVRFENPI
jgi:predicted nucleic acid-binding protein